MPFIGTSPVAGFKTTTKQSFSGDNSTTAFTLNRASSSNTDLEVFVDNIQQEPTTAYSVSGTTLTFTEAPPTGTNNVYVVNRGGDQNGLLPPQDLGTTDYIFGDDISFNSDSAKLNFGADSEITITHVADTGLNLKHTATGDDKPIVLTLQTGETDIAADDVIGKINFQAPDEGTGTDAILVAAGIQAISEGDFSSSVNATSLQFMTGASETATAKASITSGGDIKVLTDGASIFFGADSEIELRHVADDGLILKHVGTGDGKEPSLTFQAGDNDIAADDVLGSIFFQAPDEGTGTDAILVAAGIEAVSEGDFSSSSNATKLSFKTASSAAAAETMSLSSGGNLAVTGSITANSASTINVTGGSALTLKSTDAGATAGPVLFLQRDSASPADNDICGRVFFRADNDAGEETDFIRVESVLDDVSDGSENGSLRFFSMLDGTIAERMRINSNGHLIIGSADFSNNLSNTNSHEKIILENDGDLKVQGAAKAIATFNRNQTDGTVILIQQENTSEGSIAVSGTTVSFDGFAGRHESSGIPTDTEKGTVVSTIDELDVYPAKQGDGKKEEACPKAGQTRADHAKVKISDTVGDKRVYGVVDTYTAQDKLMVASVGIASVKVTGACEGGDLLESNGDGTAKVQSDDIIRSKTIGKVTIGNSNVGVKLVSCVLYCG